MKRLPLRKSILIIFSLVFLLLIALICTAVSGYVQDNAIRQQQAYLKSYTASIAQQADSLFDELNKISVLLYTSSDIGDIFTAALSSAGTENYLTRQTARYARIDDAVYSIVGPDITNIIVNMYNDRCFYSSKYYSILWENVVASQGGGRLAAIAARLRNSVDPVVTFVEAPYWTDSYNARNSYISLSRRFEKVTTHKDIGYIEIMMPIKFIAKLFGTADAGQTILLVDGEGSVLYGTGELPRELMDFVAAPNSGEAQPLGIGQGGTYFYGANSLDPFDLKVYTFQKYDPMQHMQYIYVVLSAGLILYVCMLVLCVIISRRLSAPLNSIVTSLKRVSWDTLEMNLHLEDNHGEYAVLEDAYSAMMMKLRESIDSVINARLNEQKSAFMALQSQISPHFIYNTIATISACGYENGVDKIVDICDKLSGLLRYATDYTNTFSDIEREMEHTENYLELMKARYEDRFFYQLHCAPQCQGFQIPRLIIQSVLENCFKHAFQGTPPPWFISVEAYIKDGWWFVDIISGGSRIPPETLRFILEKSGEMLADISAGSEHLKQGGLGLLNAIIRLRLFTRDRFIFQVLDGKENTHITRLGGKLP